MLKEVVPAARTGGSGERLIVASLSVVAALATQDNVSGDVQATSRAVHCDEVLDVSVIRKPGIAEGACFSERLSY
jgi:hypothetical protein